MSKSVSQLISECYLNASSKGFWDEKPNFMEKLMLIVTEVSEAAEIYRQVGVNKRSIYEDNGKPVGLDSEMADIAIRLFDLCGHYGIDLERAIEEKMAYNKSRPYMHNKLC